MPITVSGTQITFNDSTTQTTAGGPYSGQRGQVFASSGTFTIPTGVTAIKVTVCGGGGGGGAVSVGNGTGGGGGGGGAGVQYFTSLTPGATLAVTVGGGGAGGTGGGNPGSTGGTSQIASGNQSITTLSATGGNGGLGSGNGGPGTIGTTTNAAYPLVGGGGSFIPGYPASAGQTSPFGRQTLAPAPINNGTAGALYGGGGSGGVTNNDDNRAGGAGAAGIVFIEW